MGAFVGDTNKLPVLPVFAQAVGFSFRRFLTILRLGLVGIALGALVVLGTIAAVMPDFFEAGSASVLLEPVSQEQPSQTRPSQAPEVDADAVIESSGAEASGPVFTASPNVTKPPQTEDLQELDPALIYVILSFALAMMLVNAIVSAPVMRHITTDDGVPIVPLNASLLRYILTGIILIFLYLFFYILFVIGIVVLAAALALLQVPEPVFMIAVFGTFMIGYFYVLTRLSLIQVDAIAEGSIDTLRSWRLSEGNVLRLLLLILLGTLVGNVVNLLLQGLTEAIAYFTPLVETEIDPALSMFEALALQFAASPGTLMLLGVLMLGGFWSTGFYAAMVSFAWRAIKGTPEEETT